MVVCWLCCAEVKQNHPFSLFSPPSLKVYLPGRLSRLAKVSSMQECLFRDIKQTEHSSRKGTAEVEGVSQHTAQARPNAKCLVSRVLFSDKKNAHRHHAGEINVLVA